MSDTTIVTIIGVFMPSTNLSINEYISSLEVMSDCYDRFIEEGPVIVLGDFNAHISRHLGINNYESCNTRGRHLFKCLTKNNLILTNTQPSLKCPNYTYTNSDGSIRSIIDHIYFREFTSCETYKS